MNATVDEVFKKMVDFSEANLHDINHLLKVWGFARHIGMAEKLDETTQYTLELAAIVHDIACPLCRIKYGNTNGKYQEKEGYTLTYEFFKDLNVPSEIVDRIAYLVSHHHTYTDVTGLDYQILLEADFLVNADESSMGREAIIKMRDDVYKTATGKYLLNSMYLNK